VPLNGKSHLHREVAFVVGHAFLVRRTLKDFVEGRRGYKDHSALKAALDAWFNEVRKAVAERVGSKAELRHGQHCFG
jgi:hypothetical protein